jgi:glycosyltransferase involved in cell wall biosynthesis
MTDPLFSIAICTYNRYDKLPLAIQSALEQKFDPALFDVWVIDNTPACAQRTEFREKCAGIQRLHYVEVDTPGLSHARNIAVESCQAQWVVFLDDDAILVPEALPRYREVIELYGETLGGMGGRIDPAFDGPRPSWLADELLCFLSVGHLSDTVCEYPESLSPIGANMVLRRADIKTLGGFDVSLGRNGARAGSLLSGEESSLFIALRAAGKKIVYTPLARAVHIIAPERLQPEWFRRRFAWQGVSDASVEQWTEQDHDNMKMWIKQYIEAIPQEETPTMGLFWETDNPAAFAHQMKVVRYLTYLLLRQGKVGV